MKMKWFSYLILCSILIFWQAGYADSPATSTPFSQAYLDCEIVRQAGDQGVLTDDMCRFLTDLNIPIDHKAALINALSWAFEGKDNGERFSRYLFKKYRFQTKKLPLYGLNGSELMCLGYLKLLDDYFHPEPALIILEKAVKIKSSSFTVHIVNAIARGQVAFDSDWCRIWKYAEAVFGDASLTPDMRPDAIQIIRDYLILYQESCG